MAKFDTHTNNIQTACKLWHVTVCSGVCIVNVSMTESALLFKSSKIGKWLWDDKEQVLSSTKKKPL